MNDSVEDSGDAILRTLYTVYEETIHRNNHVVVAEELDKYVTSIRESITVELRREVLENSMNDLVEDSGDAILRTLKTVYGETKYRDNNVNASGS